MEEGDVVSNEYHQEPVEDIKLPETNEMGIQQNEGGIPCLSIFLFGLALAIVLIVKLFF